MPGEDAACPNPSCSDYAKRGAGNLVPMGRAARGGRQRMRCATCGTAFAPTRGTYMYRLQISEQAFLEAVMLHYGGYSSRRIARSVGVSKTTVLRALDRAARYAEQVKLALVRTGKAPQDVAERLAELIRWRAATKAGDAGATTRASEPGSLRRLAGAWAHEDCGAILKAIYRLREHAGAA